MESSWIVVLLLTIMSLVVMGERNSSSSFVPKLSIENETLSPTVLAPLLVSTRNGLLRGMSLKTSNRQKTVSAFLGVPFARPPGIIESGNIKKITKMKGNFR